MRYFFYLLCGALPFLSVSSCGQPAEQPSVPDEKMARIMADLCIAEAATKGLNGYAKDSLTHAYYEQVMQIHGITQEQYEKNLSILANDLPRMEEVIRQAEELVKPEPKR